jgi:hypothetical protein
MAGWLMVELVFLPIMAIFAHVHGQRVRLPYLCLKQVVVFNMHTQMKPDVSRFRHCNTCGRVLVTGRH